MSVRLPRMTGLAVACVVLCSASNLTNARILDVSQSLSPVDFDVCQNPFVFRESEMTNVLKALLGEALNPLQVAGR